MYTYIELHLYMHTHMHACMHAYIHTYLPTCPHAHIHTYMHTYILWSRFRHVAGCRKILCASTRDGNPSRLFGPLNSKDEAAGEGSMFSLEASGLWLGETATAWAAAAVACLLLLQKFSHKEFFEHPVTMLSISSEWRGSTSTCIP